MIPVPKPVKLAVEDLGPKAPEWAQKLLASLNGFLSDTVNSFSATAASFNSKSVDVETPASVVITAQPFPVEFRPTTRPTSVWIGQVLPLSGNPTMTSAVTIPRWELTTTGLVRIPFITGLPVSSKLRITFEYR